MFNRNMGPRERVARIVVGALLICTGFVALQSSGFGIAVAAMGGITLATGAFSYCPACAIAGRPPKVSN